MSNTTTEPEFRKDFSISQLNLPEWNPRKVTDEKLDLLEESIEINGMIQPVIVNSLNNTVLAGSQRITVLQGMGKETVDCYFVNIPEDRQYEVSIALNGHVSVNDIDKMREVLKQDSSLWTAKGVLMTREELAEQRNFLFKSKPNVNRNYRIVFNDPANYAKFAQMVALLRNAPAYKDMKLGEALIAIVKKNLTPSLTGWT